MEACVLTFVIPVRHPENSPDWSALKQRLTQTVRSIAGQDDPRWRAILVANEGSDLPELPHNFHVERVRFPPNPMFEQGSHDREAFLDSCRIDKGRRVLAGMLAAGTDGYSMVVDDDDFVSCRLTSFAAAHPHHNGWYMPKGYVWGDGGKLFCEFVDFWKFCGTSHIIRTALYELPPSVEQANFNYMREIFGSHVLVRGHLEARGTALDPLPFAGAIYRIGHAGAHSRSAGLFRQIILRREVLKNPWELAQRVFRLRLMNDALRRQFWGRPLGDESP